MSYQEENISTTQQPGGNICPYLGQECPYRQFREEELDPSVVRQRRPNPNYYHRPNYYHHPNYYHRPNPYPPYFPPYFPPLYPPFYPPYYPTEYDEEYY